MPGRQIKIEKTTKKGNTTCLKAGVIIVSITWLPFKQIEGPLSSKSASGSL